jgi:glyoxylate carboligase
MPTVAEAIVDALADLGVRTVWGVVGDALNPVTDAIRREERLEWIGTRHEEVAAFAAGAQAQLTGTLGVCIGTAGPGSIHLVNGLYDASKSHAPVLAICGQVPVHPRPPRDDGIMALRRCRPTDRLCRQLGSVDVRGDADTRGPNRCGFTPQHA